MYAAKASLDAFAAMTDIDQYDYQLPPELIAQEPLPNREDARLLVVRREARSLEHMHVRDLPEILQEGDCLVINDTRVIPARLVGYRQSTGGRWKGLFLEANEHGFWRLLGKARTKVYPGEKITLTNRFGQDDITLELAARQSDGTWVARPLSKEDTLALLERVGRVPLPPYIRKGEMLESDREHYQTVYARHPGSVAAPTAGLHFTERLLERLIDAGITITRLTLHIGPATFRPIKTQTIEEHRLDPEWGSLEQTAVDTITACRARGGRVVAVGTTCTRLLETAASSGTLRPFRGMTDLYIRPPYRFRIVDALMTNFHLPRSTLLVLVRTFGGDELIRRAYQQAIQLRYRFYSYGDAMLII